MALVELRNRLLRLVYDEILSSTFPLWKKKPKNIRAHNDETLYFNGFSRYNMAYV